MSSNPATSTKECRSSFDQQDSPLDEEINLLQIEHGQNLDFSESWVRHMQLIQGEFLTITAAVNEIDCTNHIDVILLFQQSHILEQLGTRRICFI
mmetsp:Transcript_36740/g.70665  ORF Transcript_36740/g.70665 Transcript_36740/m.70665 type:complete len:95 (+) Transcript_36740:20-304(+)